MTLYKAEDKAKIRREKAKYAIELAMNNRWVEAIDVNKEIIEVFPSDVEAHNRLGKALMERGRYSEAREAFKAALDLAPNNTITKKNLHRLSLLEVEKAPPVEDRLKMAPHLFIEETGKTGIATLVNPAPQEVLARVTPGEQVYLKVKDHSLLVESNRGDYLGEIEPKLALRLMKLMKGGNKYEAAVTSLDHEDVRVIIKEVYQHPSQAGRVSFPFKEADDFRAYVKEGVFKYEPVVEETYGDEEQPTWQEETESANQGITIVDMGSAPLDAVDQEDEEEQD